MSMKLATELWLFYHSIFSNEESDDLEEFALSEMLKNVRYTASKDQVRIP